MKAANNNNIAKVMGISYTPVASNPNPIIHATPLDDKEDASKAEADYEYARRNIYDLIEKGSDALEDMLDYAKQAQSAKAFETVSGMIGNLVDANRKLLHLSKQMKDIRKDEIRVEQSTSTSNTMFVGSTTDLLKMLKSRNE